MRIISGIYRNTPLLSPKSSLTHPMGDREKLALFNMLNPVVSGAVVLDAFAGTGALGLEALSRGATSVTFLEKSWRIAKTLENNLKTTLKTPENLKKYTKIVIKDIKNAYFDAKFDLIIADPPYDSYSEALLRPLIEFLAPSGILALSIPRSAPTPLLDGLTSVSEHTYASAKILIYRHSA